MVVRIPYLELEIQDGWRVADLVTQEDCDEASVQLTRDIASIEAQIAEHDRDTRMGAPETDDDADWLRSARAALKIKKEIQQVVLRRRSDIGKTARMAASRDRNARLIAHIKAAAPDAFAAALAEVEEA